MSNNSLPPLPGSDQYSLQRNKYDSYYRVGSREFWGDNAVTSTTLDDKKCSHYFVSKGPIVECKHCHFGLNGTFAVKDGNLFFNNTEIRF